MFSGDDQGLKERRIKLSLGYCQLVWREAAGTGIYQGTLVVMKCSTSCLVDDCEKFGIVVSGN